MARSGLQRIELSGLLNQARASSASASKDLWTQVGESSVRSAELFPSAAWWLVPLAEAALRNDCFESLFLEACGAKLAEDPNNEVAMRLTLRHHLGRGTEGDVEALALRSRNLDADSGRRDAVLVTAARILHETGKSHVALELLGDRTPLNNAANQLAARIHGDLGDCDGVLKVIDSAVATSGSTPNYLALVTAALLVGETRSCRERLSAVLSGGDQAGLIPLIKLEGNLGRLAEAESLIDQAPSSPEMEFERGLLIVGTPRLVEVESICVGLEKTRPDLARSLRGELASVRGEYGRAEQIWRESSSAGNSANLWRRRVRALANASCFNEAWALLETHVSKNATHRNRLDRAALHRTQRNFEPAAAEIRMVIADHSASLAIRSKALQIATQLGTTWQNNGSWLDETAGWLGAEQCKSALTTINLAKCEIARERASVAEGLVDQLPEDVSTFDSQALRSWRLSQQQDERANRVFDDALSSRFYASLHAPEPTLSLQSGEPDSVSTHDLVIFAFTRDEMFRLPAFFDHYRGLGVEKFVFIDNGSIDGSVDYLASQSDAVVYQTEDDFVTAGMGIRWINYLVDQLQPGRWVMFLNVDEHAVFADDVTKSLPELAAELEHHGFTAAGGFTLDMHGEFVDSGCSYVVGEPMVKTLPYFTNDYFFQPFLLSPYEDVRGGFRENLLGANRLQMTKTPLIRADKGIRFLTSSHEVTPAVVAPRSVVLMHFKYIGNTVERHRLEVEWADFSYWGNSLAGIESIDPGESLFTEATVQYGGSSTLVELGLLKCVAPVEGSVS